MSHVVTVKIYDLASNELADITGISLTKSLTVPFESGNAPRSFTLTAPAGSSLLTAIAADGYRVARKGNRKLIVWEDGDVVFHGRIFTVERTGDGTANTVTITGFDPRAEFGYEADGRAGRPVRGSTVQPTAGDPFGHYDGNFINPKFASSVIGQAGISGPDLIFQVLTNSQNTGPESDPTPGEGPLPIDLSTGVWDLACPPAVDLSVEDVMDWPIKIGDFISKLVETNAVDFDIRPVDPTEGFDPYVMGVCSAVSQQGTDRSATVHFDYWTGDKNAQAFRHVEDFTTICNKLYDNLGPRLNPDHWKGLISPGSPGTTVDPTASRALYGGPGADKGTFMEIRAFDSLGVENSARPLYLALWNAEQGMRVEPRDLLFITPADDTKGLFTPPQDFDRGDIIAINLGAEAGLEIADTQRVYGYVKSWTREGVAEVAQLVTSADA